MLRRTFLGLLPAGLFPMRWKTSPMIEKILPYQSPEKPKPILVIQVRMLVDSLYDWRPMQETFKDFDVLIVNNADCSIVNQPQTYFNWQTMHLPTANLYSKTGELIQQDVVWVETKYGLVGILNEHNQMEVYQYPDGLEVRFK